MPFFRDKNLDDQNQTQQGSGVQLSSGGMQADPSGNPNQADSGTKSANSGSKFQNLDAYIQNNDAKGFGEKFGQNVQNSIDEAKKTITDTTGQVKSQINAGANPASQDQINAAIAGAGTNKDTNAAKQYQDWTSQTYQGPHSLAETPDAQNKIEGGIQSANIKTKLAGTEPGRFSLLDQYFGRPSYSFGEKALDNMLIQRGGGFNNQAQLQGQAAQLGDYGAQQAKSIQDAASQRAGQIEQSRQAARSAIGLQDDNTIKGGPLADIQSQAEARMKEYNTTQNNDYNTILQQIQGNKLNTNTANLVGLKNGRALYDLDPSKYLQHGVEANKYSSGVADPKDYARYIALSQMAGTNPGYYNEGDSDKLGQSVAGNSFRTEDLQNDIAGRESGYNSAIAQINAQYAHTPNSTNDYGLVRDTENQGIAQINAQKDAEAAKALAQLKATYQPGKKLNIVGGDASLGKNYGTLMKGLK